MKHTLLGITKTFGRSSTRLLLVVAIALSSLSIITPASTSAAGETYRMTNANTIQGSGGSYSNANNLFTTVQSGTTTARAAIGTLTFTKNDSGAFVSKVVNTQWQAGTSAASCQMQLSIRLSGSSGTISAVPSGNANASTCLDRAGVSKTFTVANTSATPATKEACEAAGGRWVDPSGSGAYGCATATENNGGDDGAGATEDEQADTSLCNGVPVGIRWAACPVTELLQAAVSGIDEALHAALDYDTAAFSNAGYQGAWAAFRTIALALIVIAGLMIVIGQAAGIQILDAYTIKKAIPRLLIAVIFIALSWPLMELVVTFVNDIGKWVEGIMEAPFSSIQTSSGETTGVALINWSVVGVLAVVIAGGSIAGLWPVIFSFLFVGVVGVLIAMLVVGIRTALITLCIIVAPLAIACSILPATDKAFDLWRKTFISCLIVYPIIMMLLAAGKISSYMVDSQPIISMLLYFAPYFMIPFAFRLAGGVMGKIAGFANSAERGIFDKQRKSRQAQYDRMGQNFRNGALFNGESRRAKGLNSAVGTIAAARHIKSPRNMRAQMQAAESAAVINEAQEQFKSNAAWAAIKDSDTLREAFTRNGASDIDSFLKTQAGYTDEDNGGTQRRQLAVAQVAAAQRNISGQTRRVMKFIGDAADGTVFNIPKRDKDNNIIGFSNTMAEGAVAAADGDRLLAERLMFTARGMSSQSRGDTNISAGQIFTDLGKVYGDKGKDGQRMVYDDKAKIDTLINGFLNSNDQVLAQQKGVGAKNIEFLVERASSNQRQIAQLETQSLAPELTDEQRKTILEQAQNLRTERDKIVAKVESVQETALRFGNSENAATYSEAVLKIKGTQASVQADPSAELYNTLRPRGSYSPIDTQDPRYQSGPEPSDDDK